MSLELAKVSIKVEADTSGIKDDFDKAERIAKEAGQDAAKKFNEGIEKAGGDIDVNGKVKVRGGRGGRGGRGAGIGGLAVGMGAAAAAAGRAAPLIGGALAGVGIGAGVAAAGTAAFVVDVWKAADATMSLEAGLMNVREQMGFTGKGFKGTTERLDQFARSAVEATGVQQDLILQAQTTLATFGNIGKTMKKDGGVFDRATLASMDLAAAGFGSVESNAVQLGKALNDPITGLGALGEAGVTFTNAEKEMIKGLVESGKMLEAQDMLLKAIETQVGGTAEATASAGDKLSSSWAMLKSDFGRDLAPTLDTLADTVREDVLPQLKGLWDTLSPDLNSWIESFGDWLAEDGIETFQGMVDWIKTDGVTWLGRFADAAGFVGEQLGNMLGSFDSALLALEQTGTNVDANGNPIKGSGFGGFLDTVGRTAGAIPGLVAVGGAEIYNAGTAFGNDIRKNGFFGSFNPNRDKSMYDVVGSTYSAWDKNERARYAKKNYSDMLSEDNKGRKNAPSTPKMSRRIPAMAKGGYVTSPTLALVGEAGPEYVLPEKKLQSMGGVTVNVHVEGDADAPKVKRIVEQTLDETLQSGALALVAGGM